MSNNTSEVTLDRRADVFRRRKPELVQNTHIQELRMLFELITAVLVQFEGGQAQNEIHKPVWSRLINSGNIRRTRRRMADGTYELTQQFVQYRSILNGPNFRKLIEHQGAQKEAWQVVAEMLSELMTTIVFLADPQRAEERGWVPQAFKGLSASEIELRLDELSETQPFSLKTLSEDLAEDDLLRSEAAIIEFCELGLEVCSNCLQNPLGVAYRPGSHFLSGTIHLKTDAALTCVSYSETEYVDYFPVYMQDKKDDIYFYFLMGPEATLAMAFLGMPNIVLKGLSRVVPKFGEIYAAGLGHTLEERFDKTEEPRDLIMARLGKIKRPVRRKRSR